MKTEDIEELGASVEQNPKTTGGRVVTEAGLGWEGGKDGTGREGRVFLEVFGCSHANSDGEYLGGQLVRAGYRLVERMEESTVCVIYGCTVKNPSEDSFLNAVERGHRMGKKVVGCGCVVQADPENVRIPNGVALVGVRGLGRIVEVVEKLEAGEALRLVPRVAVRLSKAERRKMGRRGFHPGMYFSFSCIRSILYGALLSSFVFLSSLLQSFYSRS